MAGLGLTDAVRIYQQGVQWTQQQEVADRELQQRRVLDEANKAAGSVIDAAKGEWALNGAQGQFVPNDSTMMMAAEARSQALAKGGDWGNFLQNEAAVQGIRTRIRARALQQYESDGDATALAQTVYPTLFDGKQIVGVEKSGGMPALESIGRPATPVELKFKLSDGTEKTTTPDKIVAAVKSSLVDPQKQAEMEIMGNMLRMKTQIETEGKQAVERTKGEEARTTEGVKHTNALALENLKLRGQNEIHAADRAAQIQIAAGHDAATKYAADQRLEGVQYRSNNPSAGKGSNGLQRTFADADGFMVGTFRDGATRRLLDEKGKPVRSQDWSKRVDALAKTLRDTPGNYSKSPDELRQLAVQNLSRGYSAPGASGLDAFDAGGAPKKRPSLSSFYTDQTEQ